MSYRQQDKKEKKKKQNTMSYFFHPDFDIKVDCSLYVSHSKKMK